MQQIPITIRDEIESINFPSIPYVLFRFLKVVEDERATIGELAALVGQDPALSARFLTVANSPALRREKEILNLEQCMITLGTRLARTLAACLAIQSVFARAAGESQYDFKGFWRHSLRVAEMSRLIAAATGYSDAEEAYLAGLMHDIGLLLLLGSKGDLYGDILQRSVDEAVLSDIEKPVIGSDHASVGAWLIDHWKLSSFMSDAILFHHKSSDEISGADPLSKIVWCSHVISGFSEKLDLTHVGHLPDLAAVTSMLGIDMHDVAAIRDRSSGQITLLAEALGVAESADARMLPAPVIAETCRLRHAASEPVLAQMDELVRDMALMQSLHLNLSSMCSEEDIFIAVKESARILFSLGRLAFLLVNSEKATLSGANFLGQSPLLKRLDIKLESGSSLAAAVALGTQPCATFDRDRPAAVSLVDVQIAHILDSEGVLYVPMRSADRHIGVMACGISISQHARLTSRLAWLTGFAHLAAVSIEAWRETKAGEAAIEANLMNRFERQARRVAHEAGNPLSIIRNYLKIVSRKIPDEHDVSQELEILREEIDRVAAILQGLHLLNATATATGTVDVNKVIEGMLTLYGDSLFSAAGISVEKSLDPAIPLVSGDRDSLKQILLNIWKNAAEALADGGRVEITTRGGIIKNGRRFAELSIRDSGPGLPPDVAERLFQPLGPDRRPEHSGIGLSVVATLVESLGGFITCESAPGTGTLFHILLPYVTGESA